MEDLGFRFHLSHQIFVTEVRSGTFTSRKRTFDPHKLNCGTTTTFLPLQFSPPVEPRSPLVQTEPTADSITEEVQAEASKKIFTSAERLGRKAEIITPFCSVCYLFISFWKSNRNLTGKRGHKRGMKHLELQEKVRKVRRNWRQWRKRKRMNQASQKRRGIISFHWLILSPSDISNHSNEFSVWRIISPETSRS